MISSIKSGLEMTAAVKKAVWDVQLSSQQFFFYQSMDSVTVLKAKIPE